MDAIDIPDPSKEELELLYAKRKKEIKKIKIEKENSWNWKKYTFLKIISFSGAHILINFQLF